MAFELPASTDIEVDIDGRPFRGTYSFMLGDLIVYYNGRAKTVRKSTEHVHEIALDLLRQLVEQYYVEMDSVPEELPQRMREAAHVYANSFGEDEPIRALIETFGEALVGSGVHTQVSWLCVNAIQPIVPFWKMMCDDDAPERTLAELGQWLNDRTHPVDWESARQPAVARCDGLRIVDCDACRVEPIAGAVVCCADYLENGDIDSAVGAIFEAQGAKSEGCWPEYEERLTNGGLSKLRSPTPINADR